MGEKSILVDFFSIECGKIYFTKNCPIWFRLSHFLDKSSGKIMVSFNQNGQLFIKKLFSPKMSLENHDTFFASQIF